MRDNSNRHNELKAFLTLLSTLAAVLFMMLILSTSVSIIQETYGNLRQSICPDEPYLRIPQVSLYSNESWGRLFCLHLHKQKELSVDSTDFQVCWLLEALCNILRRLHANLHNDIVIVVVQLPNKRLTWSTSCAIASPKAQKSWGVPSLNKNVLKKGQQSYW